jgi:hypothetical protein
MSRLTVSWEHDGTWHRSNPVDVDDLINWIQECTEDQDDFFLVPIEFQEAQCLA